MNEMKKTLAEIQQMITHTDTTKTINHFVIVAQNESFKACASELSMRCCFG